MMCLCHWVGPIGDQGPLAVFLEVKRLRGRAQGIPRPEEVGTELGHLFHHPHCTPWEGAWLEVGQGPGTLAKATYPHLSFSVSQTLKGLCSWASSWEDGEELHGKGGA